MLFALVLVLAGSLRAPFSTADCKLTIGGNTALPVHVGSGNPVDVVTSKGVLTFEGADIRFKGASGQHWRTADGTKPSKFLCEEAGIAYLAGSGSTIRDYEDTEEGARVSSLDLKTGKWLQTIQLSPPNVMDKKIVGAAVHAGKLALLLASYRREGDVWNLAGLGVEVLNAGSGAKIWTYEVPDKPDRTYLYHDLRRIKTVQWVNDRLVVCTGPAGPVLAFDGKGGLDWRIDRPWEFQRTSGGPGVYENFLIRPGEQRASRGSKKAAEESSPNQDIRGEIVAGPIWMPGDASSRRATGLDLGGRFVIAAGYGSASRGASLDSLVYEFDEKGIPETRTSLPFFVEGGSDRVMGDRIAWPSNNGGLVRLRALEQASKSGRGPFGHRDRTAHIDWLVQDAPMEVEERVEAYTFSSDAPREEAIVYTRTKAIRSYEGWHCSARTGEPVKFPLRIIDLATGGRTACTLSVRLTVPVDKPESNYLGVGSRFASHVPLFVQITRLELHGDELRVFLADDEGEHPSYADFRLPADCR